jgi:hypothetical protein
VVQPWGGVKDLRIDRMTASSNYQGLMLQPDLGPIGSAEISNVDLTASADPTSDKGGHLLWVTKGSQSCTGSPMTLSDVFVLPRAGRSLSNSVWPPANSSLECGASGETLATWPRLAVAGGVHLGLPPGGSFVPAGSVGIGYSSPGYAGS